jgi:hypothetical protein
MTQHRRRMPLSQIAVIFFSFDQFLAFPFGPEWTPPTNTILLHSIIITNLSFHGTLTNLAQEHTFI